MFSHLSVSHSVHSGVCVTGGVCGGSMHGGGMHACMEGVCVCQGGVHGRGCVWWGHA